MGLGVKAAGRVHDEDVSLPGPSGLEGIMGHGAWVGPLPVSDHLRADLLAPELELLDGCGPKGVAGCQHHPLPFAAETGRQLGDARRFARAVDAHHHHHVGRRRRDLRNVLARKLKERAHLLLQERKQVPSPRLLAAGPQPVQQGHGGGHAHVCTEEKLFGLVPEVGVHLGPLEDPGQA